MTERRKGGEEWTTTNKKFKKSEGQVVVEKGFARPKNAWDFLDRDVALEALRTAGMSDGEYVHERLKLNRWADWFSGIVQLTRKDDAIFDLYHARSMKAPYDPTADESIGHLSPDVYKEFRAEVEPLKTGDILKLVQSQQEENVGKRMGYIVFRGCRGITDKGNYN